MPQLRVEMEAMILGTSASNVLRSSGSSILLVVALPLQLAGFIEGPVTNFIWIPMLLFEVPLALWLLIKGVALPQTKG